MFRKLIIFVLGLILGTTAIAYAAPTAQNFNNIQPFTTNTYNNGVPTLQWLNFYTKNASTTNLQVLSAASGIPGCATFDNIGQIGNTNVPCGTGGGGAAYPFTPSTNSGIPTSATSTAIDDTVGLFLRGTPVATTSLIVCLQGPPTCQYTDPEVAVQALPSIGGTVHIKTGTYTLTQPLKIPTGYDNVVIEGEGVGTVLRWNRFNFPTYFLGEGTDQKQNVVLRDLQISQSASEGTSNCIDFGRFADSWFYNLELRNCFVMIMASTSAFQNHFTNIEIHNGTGASSSVSIYNGANDNEFTNVSVSNISSASKGFYFDAHSNKCYLCDVESFSSYGLYLGPNADDFIGDMYLELNQTNAYVSAGADSVNLQGTYESASTTAQNIVDGGAQGLRVNAFQEFDNKSYFTGDAFGLGVINPVDALDVMNNQTITNNTRGLFGGRGSGIGIFFHSGASESDRYIVNDIVSSNFPTLDFVLSSSTEQGMRLTGANTIGTGDVLIQGEASSSGYFMLEGRATSTAFGPQGTFITSINSPVLLGPNRAEVLRVATSSVGIGGTSTPAQKLGVQGNIFVAGDVFSTSTSANVFPYATTTVTSAQLFCLTGDTCISAWPAPAVGTGAATTSFAATYPITLTTSASAIKYGFNGLATTTAWTPGQLAMVQTDNQISSVATTTVSCTGTASCTSFVAIGSSPITITGSGGSGGGGSGNVSTSSAETATRVPFWTTTNATPALLSGGNSTFTFTTAANRLSFTYASTTALSATQELGVTSGGGVNFDANSSEALVGIGQNYGSVTKTLVTGNSVNILMRTATAAQGITMIGTAGNSVAEFRNDGKIYFPKNVNIGTTTGSGMSMGQLNIASSTGVQLDFLSGTNQPAYGFRAMDDGSLWVGTSTLSGATTTSPVFSLNANGGFTITSLSSSGTGCLQASSAGLISQTGSPCSTSGTSVSTSSLAATFPIQLTTSPSSITYSFGGLSTTSPWTIGDLAMVTSGNQISSVSTSTLTPSSPLTGSITTIGSGSLGIQSASASQNGYLTQADFQLIHAATTTFSAPLVYTLSTNAVTCTNASAGVNGCMSALDWALLHTATTTFSSPLVYTQSTNAVTCPTCVVTTQAEHHSFSYATSTWTGTTTIQLEVGYDEVWNSVRCYTNIGTLNMKFLNNASALNQFIASTTPGIIAFTTNNTMTAANKISVDIGTSATAPTTITCTVKDTPV